MKKTTIIFLILLVALPLTTYYVIAPLVQQWLIPQTATISNVSYTMYIDSVLWTNNTLLDWGPLDPGASYTCNLTIVNTSNVNATFYLLTDTLPVGWSESWTANATLLEPTQVASGDWTLTVDVAAVPGDSYNWNSWVGGEQS